MGNKSVKLNFIFNIIKSVMTLLFPIISFPYIARVLGVDGIGKVQYCISVISYFSLFAALGISLYAVREGSKIRDNRYELSKFSKEMLVINLISTTIVYVVLLLSIIFGMFKGYEKLLLVTSLLIIFTTLAVEWIYQIVEDYAYISLRSVIFQVISIIALFVFVKTKNDYLMYTFIYVFSTAGFFFLNLFSSKKYVDLNVKCKLELKKHLKPIFVIFGVSAASSIYLNLDVIMIRMFRDDYQVGLYTTAIKVNSIVKTLIASVSIVVIPKLSNFLKEKKIKEYNILLKSGIDLNLILSIPSAIGLFMLSNAVVVFFSGEAYLAAGTASKIIAFNIICSVLDGLLYYQVLIPKGMEKQACIGTIVGAIMNLIINGLLIPFFGIEGAAVGTVISEIFVCISFVYLLRKEVDFKYMFNNVFKIILAALPILPICYLCQIIFSSTLIILITSVSISAIVYYVCLLLLKIELAHVLLRDALNIVRKLRRV